MTNRWDLVFLLVFFGCAATALEPANEAADQFVERVVESLKHNEVTLSRAELDALRTAHRVLLLAADDRIIRASFWDMVRNSPREHIQWDKAKEMILEGRVSSVLQAHSCSVYLRTDDGRNYGSKEPHLDDVHHLVEQVDPKHVFVAYATE